MINPWLGACRELAELILASEYNGDNFFEQKLHDYILDINPDILIDAYRNAGGNKSEFYTRALIDLSDKERKRLFKVFIRDLYPFFKEEAQELEAMVKDLPIKFSEYTTTDKMYRYLKRIDSAIVERRYSLALKLTNRCLKEYYATFLSEKTKEEIQSKDYNASSLSVRVCRYIVKYFDTKNIGYSIAKISMIALTSNTIHLAADKIDDTNPKKKTSYIDKSLAIFARNNLSAIIRYLKKYW